EIVERWLPACQHIADVALARDPYAGVILKDPYDGAIVRWHPVRRKLVVAAGAGAVKILANAPVGRPNTAGDYPRARTALRRMISPCLVHMLDAAYAGYVLEALNDRGIKDVVSIHDCWLVPADAQPHLDAAVLAACQPWLASLAPVYDALIEYVAGHPDYEPWFRDLRDRWRKRVEAQDWPKFHVKAEALVEDKYIES